MLSSKWKYPISQKPTLPKQKMKYFLSSATQNISSHLTAIMQIKCPSCLSNPGHYTSETALKCQHTFSDFLNWSNLIACSESSLETCKTNPEESNQTCLKNKLQYSVLGQIFSLKNCWSHVMKPHRLEESAIIGSC